MTKPALLITAPMMDGVLRALDAEFSVHRLWEQADREEFLARTGPDIRGLATNTLFGRLDEALLAQLPNLEIIANFGVGYDNVDAEAAAARRVVVTNTPHVLDEEVADLTIGLVLATLRQIPQADHYLRAGRWERGPFPLSGTLRGRRVGILGLGNIGKAVARRLEGFGVPIAYHGRSPQPDVAYPWHPTLIGLASWCDVLIIVVPGGAATRHLVDAPVLEALGREGVLINIARGSVVDEAALIAALREGVIQSAGLDVYEEEPHVPADLIAMPNLVLLPHVGSGSLHTREAMGRLVVDNLIGWFRDGAALTPVRETAHLGHKC